MTPPTSAQGYPTASTAPGPTSRRQVVLGYGSQALMSIGFPAWEHVVAVQNLRLVLVLPIDKIIARGLSDVLLLPRVNRPCIHLRKGLDNRCVVG